MEEFKIIPIEKSKSPEDEFIENCRGLIFRIRESNYFDKKKLAFRTSRSATLLKRESCNGARYFCPKCTFIIDSIKEHDFAYEYSVIKDENINEKLYELKTEIESDYDYESSWGGEYVSDFWFEEKK